MKSEHVEATDLRELLERAEVAVKVRDWGVAVRDLEEIAAIEAPVLSVKVGRWLIRSYRLLGRLDAAEALGEAALAQHPNDPLLLSQHAYTAKASKRPNDALARLQRLFSRKGTASSEKTFERLAQALRVTGHHAEADALLGQGLSRYPLSASLHAEHAAVAEAQRHWNVARDRLARLIDLEGAQPTERTVVRWVAAVRRTGKPADVHREARAWLALFPDSAALRKAAGTIHPRATDGTVAPGASSFRRLDHPQVRRHPYQRLPSHAFWNTAVEGRNPLDITDWYHKKFDIAELPIATAGSCFAQHIGRKLKANGYRFVDVEPAPGLLKPDSWLDFGYGMYSARFGNVYTSRQLLQLIQRAQGRFKPVVNAWSKGDGFVDPFRPTIEPEPLGTVDELLVLQKHHLEAVKAMFEAAGVFVFTLGLTEAWEALADGAVYPVAPGVSGGAWHPGDYALRNLNHADVLADMEEFIQLARGINRTLKFIFTVSPVPLMATATDQHVAVATVHSKSVLRAVAGELAWRHDFVEYFPSFEIISAPVMRAQFFNSDMRTVSSHGVEHVMKQFFQQHRLPARRAAAPVAADGPDEDDVACDEELLRHFGPAAG